MTVDYLNNKEVSSLLSVSSTFANCGCILWHSCQYPTQEDMNLAEY